LTNRSPSPTGRARSPSPTGRAPGPPGQDQRATVQAPSPRPQARPATSQAPSPRPPQEGTTPRSGAGLDNGGPHVCPASGGFPVDKRPIQSPRTSPSDRHPVASCPIPLGLPGEPLAVFGAGLSPLHPAASRATVASVFQINRVSRLPERRVSIAARERGYSEKNGRSRVCPPIPNFLQIFHLTALEADRVSTVLWNAGRSPPLLVKQGRSRVSTALDFVTSQTLRPAEGQPRLSQPRRGHPRRPAARGLRPLYSISQSALARVARALYGRWKTAVC
jgi:hypothetical protein